MCESPAAGSEGSETTVEAEGSSLAPTVGPWAIPKTRVRVGRRCGREEGKERRGIWARAPSWT